MKKLLFVLIASLALVGCFNQKAPKTAVMENVDSTFTIDSLPEVFVVTDSTVDSINFIIE